MLLAANTVTMVLVGVGLLVSDHGAGSQLVRKKRWLRHAE